MTAFGGKSICGSVDSGNELFNRLITFWIKEHRVVRIGSSFHQLQKDLRLAGWWSLECGKAMCVLPASCKVPASLWWAAGGAGGQLRRWEMNSSRSKRAVSCPPPLFSAPDCPLRSPLPTILAKKPITTRVSSMQDWSPDAGRLGNAQ